jgi:hypothetical protein
MRARRTDSNHSEIAEAFEALGFSVWKVNDVVDLIIGYGGVSVLVEIKDINKPPSKRRLTPREEKFWSSWKGGIELVESIDDALALARKIRLLVTNRPARFEPQLQ